MNFRRVCVFCGSNSGINPAYRDAAVALGQLLAGRGIELVYGGGNVGLMGILADAVLQANGRVMRTCGMPASMNSSPAAAKPKRR